MTPLRFTMWQVAARAALCALCVSSFANSQLLFKNPPPGSVYKEYTRTMGGLYEWRVTDPNINLTQWPDAAAFLPNPELPLTVGDLTDALRAEATFTMWAGHRGTIGKKVRFNDHAWIPLPALDSLNGVTPGGFGENYMAQYCLTVDVPLSQLVVGENTFQGTNEGQYPPSQFNWGQFGWYGIVLRIYYDPSKKSHPTGEITSPDSGATIGEGPQLAATASASGGIDRVDFFAFYDGYDTDGDGVYAEYHHDYQPVAGDNEVTLRNHAGTATHTPFTTTWSTTWVPDQAPGSIKFMARVRGNNGVWYATKEITGVTLARTQSAVVLYKPVNVPESYWVKQYMENNSNTFTIPNDHPLDHIAAVKFLLRSWNGANGAATPPEDEYWIRVNDLWSVPSVGQDHAYSFDVLTISNFSGLLHPGSNIISAHCNSVHHGVEILWPGPAVIVRYDAPLLTQMLGFTATTSGGDSVRLAWSTTSERSNAGFEVQKSLHGTSSFIAVPNGFVPGHQTTTDPQSYAFADHGTFFNDTYYRLVQVNLDQTRHPGTPVRLQLLSGVTGDQVPAVFSLDQNYPNPFNPGTTLRFAIAHSGRVRLAVRTILGEEVKLLVDDVRAAGSYSVAFDGGGLTSGVYFCTLESGGHALTRKLLLLK